MNILFWLAVGILAVIGLLYLGIRYLDCKDCPDTDDY